MDNSNISDDLCNMEMSLRPEPHLGTEQDLELLAHEIAEAVVEEERISRTPSPTPSSESENNDDMECEFVSNDVPEEQNTKDMESSTVFFEVDEVSEIPEIPQTITEETEEPERSPSPIDEASWEMVDADDDCFIENDESSGGNKFKSSIVRKFLGNVELLQKLQDIGMTCEACRNQNNKKSPSEPSSNVQDLPDSCSQSMVFCSIPQESNQEDPGESEEPTNTNPQSTDVDSSLSNDDNELPERSSWQGNVAGAKVLMELEKLGGMLVVSVKISHTDLLSALASMKQLVTSAGLVSYADVDVPRLLARAA